MPQAVTHILVPLILVSVIRDFILSKKSKAHFPLHYVFIAGLAGALPDIDIPLSFVLNFLGASSWNIHKTFTHSLFFPLIFFIGFLIFRKTHANTHFCSIRNHKLKLGLICLMIAFGSLTHILLDALVGEMAYFFYPFSLQDYSLKIITLLPAGLKGYTIPMIDGILLVLWLIYLEIKHRISDFI